MNGTTLAYMHTKCLDEGRIDMEKREFVMEEDSYNHRG
jgi:hypothetical protein